MKFVTEIHPAEIGDNVFIRTVTHHHVGEVVAIDDKWIALARASWVADDGRFSVALATGELNEVEPFPDGCVVNLAAVIDIAPWAHDLPTKAK